MLLGTLVIYLVGVALLGTATAVPVLFAGAVVTGLAIGGDLPASLSLVGENAPPGRKGRAVALTHALWVAGIGTTAVLAFAFAGLGPLAARLLYAHLFVVAVVVLACRLRLREPEEWTRARLVAPPRTRRDSRHTRASRGRGHRPLLLTLAGWHEHARTVQDLPMDHECSTAGHAARRCCYSSGSRWVSSALWCSRGSSTPTDVTGGSPSDQRSPSSAGRPSSASPTQLGLVAVVTLSALGATLAGEALYKVTSQGSLSPRSPGRACKG